MRDNRDRLQDILDAIRNIERYAKQGRRVFEEDELVHTWVIHHIQIIGEAASKLSATFRKSHAHIPWSEIITMRHVLVHDYLGIDLGKVWAVVERDVEESDEDKPDVILDYDKNGNIVGMEILNASKRVQNPKSVEYAVA